MRKEKQEGRSFTSLYGVFNEKKKKREEPLRRSHRVVLD